MTTRIFALVLAGALVSATAVGAGAQEILKKEPPRGAIKHGNVVLVDDGTCPAGQIKQLTGGKSDGRGQVRRIKRCVPKK